jgi:hypothetical protein
MSSEPVHRPLSTFTLLFRLALLVVLAFFLGAVSARAQLVTPKTVPVFQDEQFNVVPTSRPGLASSFITLEDTLGDPFVNPAKLTRLRGVSVAATPYTHHITGERGGGQTFPVALYAAGAEWAGAVLGAYQNLERAGPTFNRPVNSRTSNNQYVSGLFARRMGTLSVGASASHAGLEAIDGVDLLYAGSDGIEQHGSVSEFRLGVLKELGVGHSFELLGMHNRTDMTHDVHFTTWTWDPVARQTVITQRQEQNLDQTHIWGVHSRYYRPVGANGWRVGGLVTANRLSHPKIPNYVLQNVPRDPGDTYGYNLGVGAGRLAGPTTFFVDLVIEPMRSETWADMERDTVDVTGTVLRAGTKTIENSFNFHNSKARVGAGHVFPVSDDSSQTISVDAALSVYTIGYGLRQTNNIARTTRNQAERWAEMSQSLGVRFRTREIEVSYAYRRTCGNQGCGEDENRGIVFAAEGFALASAGGIIAAPSAPLFLQSGTQSSHRFGVVVPIR